MLLKELLVLEEISLGQQKENIYSSLQFFSFPLSKSFQNQEEPSLGFPSRGWEGAAVSASLTPFPREVPWQTDGRNPQVMLHCEWCLSWAPGEESQGMSVLFLMSFVSSDSWMIKALESRGKRISFI